MSYFILSDFYTISSHGPKSEYPWNFRQTCLAGTPSFAVALARPDFWMTRAQDTAETASLFVDYWVLNVLLFCPPVGCGFTILHNTIFTKFPALGANIQTLVGTIWFDVNF